MAVNDIELNVGVKFDEAEFLDAYQSALSKTSTATQQAVEDGITKLKGSAAPDWNTLPYTTMHDASSGQRTAAKAFLASLAHDLNSAGITSKSKGFSAAMTNAAYISSIPDATERFRRLRAEGLYNEAALTAPGSALSSAIESDYALMQQGWSRNFIKSHKNKAGKKEAYIDFKGMREYAVDEGLGKWVDEAMPHTADNFELITDELEKIEDKSDKAKKLFTSWNDDLKSVLGTLTAIGAIEIGLAKFNEKAEKGTINAGSSIDKRRAFIGMTTFDELKTKVASKSVGLGEDAIKDEIYGMAENIQAYKTLGQGDMLPASLIGAFDTLLSSDTPYEAYTQIADNLYKELKGKSTDERSQYFMFMEKAGLGNMASVVGALLSNEAFAKKMGGKPSNLFTLGSNPYYSTYSQAELLLPDIEKLNKSLETSYNKMYVIWEETFGLKFKSWWDEVMQAKVVPWFEKIAGYVGGSKEKKGTLGYDVQDALTQAATRFTETRAKIANAGYNLSDASPWVNASAKNTAAKIYLPKGLKKASEGLLNWAAPVYDINEYDPQKFFNAVERASDTEETWGNPSAYKSKMSEEDKDFAYKAGVLTRWAERIGITEDLKNLRMGVLTEEGKKRLYAAMNVGRAYMASDGLGNYDETLAAYESESMLNSEAFKIIAEFLTTYKDSYKNNPDRIREIKVRLLDPLGKDIPIAVMDTIESLAGGVDFYSENNVDNRN